MSSPRRAGVDQSTSSRWHSRLGSVEAEARGLGERDSRLHSRLHFRLENVEKGLLEMWAQLDALGASFVELKPELRADLERGLRATEQLQQDFAPKQDIAQETTGRPEIRALQTALEDLDARLCEEVSVLEFKHQTAMRALGEVVHASEGLRVAHDARSDALQAALSSLDTRVSREMIGRLADLELQQESTVRALGVVAKASKEPADRYTDLERMHEALRQDAEARHAGHDDRCEALQIAVGALDAGLGRTLWDRLTDLERKHDDAAEATEVRLRAAEEGLNVLKAPPTQRSPGLRRGR